jgi:hypothetical protein
MIRRSLPEKGLYTIHLYIFLRYKENENCIKKNLLVDIIKAFPASSMHPKVLWIFGKFIVHSTSFKERMKLKISKPKEKRKK